jgi:hypothetical protein
MVEAPGSLGEQLDQREAHKRSFLAVLFAGGTDRRSSRPNRTHTTISLASSFTGRTARHVI